MNEEWRLVPGFPYEASSLGRIRRATDVIGNRGAHVLKAGTVLHGARHSGGYLVVGGRYFHRFVASAFLPNPDGLPEVNHKNGDKADNRPENLEWVTRSQNAKHAHDTGLNSPPPILRGPANPQYGRKTATYTQVRPTHCRFGHTINGVRTNGRRYCQTCKSARQRERRAIGCGSTVSVTSTRPPEAA